MCGGRGCDGTFGGVLYVVRRGSRRGRRRGRKAGVVQGRRFGALGTRRMQIRTTQVEAERADDGARGVRVTLVYFTLYVCSVL